MTLKPAPKKLIAIASKKDGGIYVPESISEFPDQAKVVGSSSELYNVGDKIVFMKYAPERLQMDEQEYLILDEADVLAKIVD